MQKFSVSVVIPTFNRAHFLDRAIRSVLAAIEPGDEIVIVDDGSTDNTPAVLAAYGDAIRVINGPHRGCGAARNAGILAARNPLVAFNDSDDEWMPDKLAMQRAFMRSHPDVLFCFSDFGIKDEDGTKADGGLIGWHKDSRSWTDILGPARMYSSIAPLPAGRADFPVHVGNLYLSIIRANYVAAQTALVWRERAGEALRFSEDLKIHEDHECFSRLAKIGQAAYFDCKTFWQWGHEGPRVSRVDDLLWSSDRITILERLWGRDAEFLDAHADVYEQSLSNERAALARSLLRSGRLTEARRELRRCATAPLALRIAAVFPWFLVRSAHTLRDMLRVGVGIAVAESALDLDLLDLDLFSGFA